MTSNLASAIPTEYYGFNNISSIHQKNELFLLRCTINQQFSKDTPSTNLFVPFPVIIISCNVPFALATEYGLFQSVNNIIRFDNSSQFIPINNTNIKTVRNLLNDDPNNKINQIFYESFPNFKLHVKHTTMNLSGLKQCTITFNNPNNDEINLQSTVLNIGVVSLNNTEQIFGMKLCVKIIDT